MLDLETKQSKLETPVLSNSELILCNDWLHISRLITAALLEKSGLSGNLVRGHSSITHSRRRSAGKPLIFSFLLATVYRLPKPSKLIK